MFFPRLLFVALGCGAPLFAESTLPRGCCAVTPEAAAWSRFAAQARATLRDSRNALPDLPSAPEGVTDLKFSEFFGPIGDRGLDYSAKMRALAGRRVRLVGFMVSQQTAVPGLFMLTGTPVATHEIDYDQCDDLPAATLHVIVTGREKETIPLHVGPLVVTGVLVIGSHAEADGRNSVARVLLDPPEPAEGFPSSSAKTSP